MIRVDGDDSEYLLHDGTDQEIEFLVEHRVAQPGLHQYVLSLLCVTRVLWFIFLL
jgi:hypothetical protein